MYYLAIASINIKSIKHQINQTMSPQKEEFDDLESLRELPPHLISMCNNDNNIREHRSSSSSSSSSVHFPPDDLLITSIHTRPCTDINDIHTLYYSADDFKHFKQTYHICCITDEGQ